MNLLDAIRNLFSDSNSNMIEQPSAVVEAPSKNANAPDQSVNFQVYDIPEPPNKKTADYIKSMKGWVYRCTKSIAQEIASVEFVLYKRTNKGEVEEVNQHEILDLLERVNSFETKFHFFESYGVYQELVGESFWYKYKVSGRTKELWQLRPDWVSILPPRKRGEFIGGYEYKIPGSRNKQIFKTDEIIHLKETNPENPFRGLGTLQAADFAYDTDYYAKKWNRNFFFNNALPSVVLTTDKNLTDKQIKRIRAEFESKYKGVDKAHKFAILGGGLKMDEAFKLSMKDMEFLETRRFSRDEIFTIFQVPKSIVAVTDDVNRANAVEHKSIFMENVIKSKMIKLVATLNEFLVHPEYGDQYYLGIKDPSPDNRELDLKIATEASDILSINERRQLIGYDEIVGGDAIRVSFSVVNEDDQSRSQGSLDSSSEDTSDTEDGQQKSILFPIKLKSTEKKDSRGKIVRHRRTKGEILAKRIREKVHPEIKKALYLLMSKKSKLTKKDNDMFEKNEITQEMKERFWKQLTAKTDIFEKKLQEVLVKQVEYQRQAIVDNLDDIASKSKKITDSETKEIARVKLNDADVFNIIEETKRILEDVEPEIMSYVIQQGAQSLDFMNLSQESFSVTANVRDFVHSSSSKFLKNMNKTTREQVVKTLEEGILEGEGVASLARRVNGVYDNFTDKRAFSIARTETLRASNYGSLEAYRQSGVVAGKEWLVALDERTCEFCLAMEQKYSQKNLNESFFDKGEKLIGLKGGVLNLNYSDVEAPPLHPQCRCTIVPILKGDEEDGFADATRVKNSFNFAGYEGVTQSQRNNKVKESFESQFKDFEGFTENFEWKLRTYDIDKLKVHVAGEADKVKQYMEAFERGDKFPPLLAVSMDGEKDILDGAHRIEALKNLGAKKIQLLVGSPKE